MISGNTLMPCFLHSIAGFDDGAHLHLENFGIGDRQAAAAVAEHGVGFVELLDAARDDVGAEAEFLGELFLLLALVRNELVQRRIDEADGDRESIHRFEYADEVAALERQELVQSFNAGFLVVGQDHFLDGALALLALSPGTRSR